MKNANLHSENQPTVRPASIINPKYLPAVRILKKIRRSLPSAAASLLALTLVLLLTVGDGSLPQPVPTTAAVAQPADQAANANPAGTQVAPRDLSIADIDQNGLTASSDFARSQTDLFWNPEADLDLAAIADSLNGANLAALAAEGQSIAGDNLPAEPATAEPLVDDRGVALETVDPAAFTPDKSKLYIKVSKANIRSLPETTAQILAIQVQADAVTRLGYGSAWSQVKTSGGKTGYVLSSLLTKTQPQALPKPARETSGMSSAKKAAVIRMAKSLLGTRYVLGGASTSGIDCSGFTLYVYDRLFNVSLPHRAAAQARRGTSVRKSFSAMQVGDLICFDWNSDGTVEHVGLYIGGGKYIDASVSAGKVRQATITGNTYWRHIKTIRRIIH